MKKSLVLFTKLLAVIPMVVLGTTLSAQPQRVISYPAKPQPVIVNRCCAENPWELTTGARSIIEAFGDLISGKGIKDCSSDGSAPNLAYTMPAKHYSNSSGPGVVTFVAFYKPKLLNPADGFEGSDKFRITWSSGTLGFTYYGVCVPEPFIPVSVENHVYAFKLFPIDQYQKQTAQPKNFSTLAGVPGIQPADIAQIMGVSIESKAGYIATHEKAYYDNPLSSKGVVVLIRLKSNRVIRCYLINNYDTAATVTWKQRNICRGI